MTDVEIKKEDIKIEVPQQEKKVEEVKEPQPNIKSEENQENWKRFREEKEKERKQRIEAEKIAAQKAAEAEALKSAMEALLNKNQQPQQQSPQDFFNDDTEEQRIAKQVNLAIAKEKQIYEEQQRKNEAAQLPQKLSMTHPDFNTICTDENIDYLQYHYPEIAIGFKHMPDNFEKWSALYKTVKKLVPSQNKRDDERRIEKNQLKPQAHAASMTDTKPETSGWRLTEERRRENWERMRRDARSI